MRNLGLVLALFLGACTAEGQAFLNYGVEKVKAAKDSEAMLLKQSPCAMGVGAKNRVLTPAERYHVEALCGGEQERPLTTEALLFELGKMLGGFGGPVPPD